METRIGSILILIEEKAAASEINQVLSHYSQLIIGRQGIPLRDKGLNVISVVVEGELQDINALSGKLGKIRFTQAKLVLAKN